MKYPAKSLRRFAPTTAVAALASATALSAILYAGTGVTAIPESADAQIVRPANGFADLVEVVRPAVVNISREPSSQRHSATATTTAVDPIHTMAESISILTARRRCAALWSVFSAKLTRKCREDRWTAAHLVRVSSWMRADWS